MTPDQIARVRAMVKWCRNHDAVTEKELLNWQADADALTVLLDAVERMPTREQLKSIERGDTRCDIFQELCPRHYQRCTKQRGHEGPCDLPDQPHSCGQCECCAAWREARESQEPRTCGTCRHWDGACYNKTSIAYIFHKTTADDGCLRGWEAK